MQNLTEKVILVTGASRGIGAAVARSLAAAGAKVIVNYAGSRADAENVVSTIRESGGDAFAVQADVSNPAQVTHLFDEAITRYGRIDVLVNNAGIMITKLIKDTTDEDFSRMFDINVKGVFNTLREAATRLADKGSIINFSTSVNRIMIPGYASYVATKAAVEQLTRVFAKEVGSCGINVNSLSPGPTNTELFTNGKSEETIARLAGMSAFGRIAEPEDISRIVCFLASDEAKWISAQNIGANGGMA
ncbi:SDR family oxidoreductase [Chitinophaga deserti]|uniref:SDR family oxidoreductase n=1 Tax=Chitinophaga deserti TaxID=2164099 RepID=UPI000D6C7993|nr:SDR family oxidoreductase [Chitinophaga deserti]